MGIPLTQKEKNADRLGFNPLGAHNDGLDISAAVELVLETGTSKVRIQALAQNVRYTLDGTTPTAAKGFQLKAGDPPIEITVGHRTKIKVIEEAATADLQYQCGE